MNAVENEENQLYFKKVQELLNWNNMFNFQTA